MVVRPPVTPPVTDEGLVRVFTGITASFCGALLVVGVIGVLFLAVDPQVSGPGLVIGVALALVSWFGSAWATGAVLAWACRTDVADRDVHGSVRTAAFVGIAVAELPALLGLVLLFAVGDGSEVGPLLVAVPVAIAAILVHASGPAALRRHLARLRG
ncbi:hypothetical protein [Cellulomonas soli]|uniref:V-ATPase proteolipid subunit C-like domain-containing protein n=1 Tax=Cellulomonas soli TaxID=931535 RepID=A0A512PGV4_9CELL|nr:hypothetical protein [Cellulomonas soli]NYI59640.1 F0F1-type ATP synthase membrane subunit c/vacuolar-type H+-ATPase subunit K [Cellulomonas soli]GEP70434.1 hypothetical protein CSO01_31490 [Cellulomonas soli]